jgi:hypothetical protein
MLLDFAREGDQLKVPEHVLHTWWVLLRLWKLSEQPLEQKLCGRNALGDL